MLLPLYFDYKVKLLFIPNIHRFITSRISKPMKGRGLAYQHFIIKKYQHLLEMEQGG